MILPFFRYENNILIALFETPCLTVLMMWTQIARKASITEADAYSGKTSLPSASL